MSIPWLDPRDPESAFPPVDTALRHPDGLLAAGGDLSVRRLLRAYRSGIFPWYETGQPILWWSPDPRTVLLPGAVRIRRSLRKRLRNRPWRVTFDRAFDRTMAACAGPRPYADGTWITPEMLTAYERLHEAGHAHSVEVWNEAERLIGGLYGVAIGRVFFGESMFSHESDASKVALVHLARHLAAWRYPLIDCQLSSPHVLSLGAVPVTRIEFVTFLVRYCTLEGHPSPWKADPALDVAAWDPSAGRGHGSADGGQI